MQDIEAHAVKASCAVITALSFPPLRIVTVATTRGIGVCLMVRNYELLLLEVCAGSRSCIDPGTGHWSHIKVSRMKVFPHADLERCLITAERVLGFSLVPSTRMLG